MTASRRERQPARNHAYNLRADDPVEAEAEPDRRIYFAFGESLKPRRRLALLLHSSQNDLVAVGDRPAGRHEPDRVDCLQPAARRQAPARSAAACSRSLSSRNPLAPGLMRCHALERQRRRGLTLALPHSASGVGRSESTESMRRRRRRTPGSARIRAPRSASCRSELWPGSDRPPHLCFGRTVRRGPPCASACEHQSGRRVRL